MTETQQYTARTVVTMDELAGMSGADLGHTEWMIIDQERIDAFAAAANDDQWIHTDPVRAAGGPFGATIAHGYLTLSLVIPLFAELLDATGVANKINYGLNKVRFPAPVTVGSAIRLAARLAEVSAVPGGLQLVIDATVEIQGAAKPACIAQPVFRFYAEQAA
jgi:acyl dehydratase